MSDTSSEVFWFHPPSLSLKKQKAQMTTHTDGHHYPAGPTRVFAALTLISAILTASAILTIGLNIIGSGSDLNVIVVVAGGMNIFVCMFTVIMVLHPDLAMDGYGIAAIVNSFICFACTALAITYVGMDLSILPVELIGRPSILVYMASIILWGFSVVLQSVLHTFLYTYGHFVKLRLRSIRDLEKQTEADSNTPPKPSRLARFFNPLCQMTGALPPTQTEQTASAADGTPPTRTDYRRRNRGRTFLHGAPYVAQDFGQGHQRSQSSHSHVSNSHVSWKTASEPDVERQLPTSINTDNLAADPAPQPQINNTRRPTTMDTDSLYTAPAPQPQINNTRRPTTMDTDSLYAAPAPKPQRRPTTMDTDSLYAVPAPQTQTNNTSRSTIMSTDSLNASPAPQPQENITATENLRHRANRSTSSTSGTIDVFLSASGFGIPTASSSNSLYGSEEVALDDDSQSLAGESIAPWDPLDVCSIMACTSNRTSCATFNPGPGQLIMEPETTFDMLLRPIRKTLIAAHDRDFPHDAVPLSQYKNIHPGLLGHPSFVQHVPPQFEDKKQPARCVQPRAIHGVEYVMNPNFRFGGKAAVAKPTEESAVI